MAGHFIILIGGPGTYAACDADHDKAWFNYIYPMQVAAERDLYNRGKDQVHWVVYEPAYQVRWLDDSEVTFWESAFESISGRALHTRRQSVADGVKKKGAANYIDRIRQFTHAHAITYKGISSPEEFWRYLATFPTQSITRTWYSGHAAEDGLILELTHTTIFCRPESAQGSVVWTQDIIRRADLSNRFVADRSKPSRFYGCSTWKFAKTWRDTFGVPAQGALKSITFSKIVDDGEKVLHGLETRSTPQGAPDWSSY